MQMGLDGGITIPIMHLIKMKMGIIGTVKMVGPGVDMKKNI